MTHGLSRLDLTNVLVRPVKDPNIQGSSQHGIVNGRLRNLLQYLPLSSSGRPEEIVVVQLREAIPLPTHLLESLLPWNDTTMEDALRNLTEQSVNSNHAGEGLFAPGSSMDNRPTI